MEAQRLKTRGPNPNPTAQAQSKRCLPLSTKTQNIIDFVSILASILGVFLSIFHKSGTRGPGPHPKVPTRHHHGPQGYPNGAPGCRNEAPRSPQSAQKTPNCTPCVSKWTPKVPQWIPKATRSAKKKPQGPAKCHKDTHRCQQAQLDTNALGKAPGYKKTQTNRPRPGARRRRRRSGRGLEGRAHQAACRSPRSGAEAENRGSSSKGFVLILK